MTSMFSVFTASILTLSVVCLGLLWHFQLAEAEKSPVLKLSPVILVPGDGGSQLEAKLNKPHRVHYLCQQKTDNFFNLWLNPGLLVPWHVDCWVDNMRLYYNHSSRTTSNSPGVEIRVPGFGNTSGVEWLDPSNKIPTYIARFILSAYYVDICNMLVNNGYTRNKNIRGAPYDYRKAPNEFQQYYADVKDLVEETFEMNSQTKVTLVCHSMGCPVISYFLSQRQKSWKNKYIKGLVSLGGAWGGALKAMKVITSGENLGIHIVSEAKLRVEQRTGPSLAYMLPSRLVWGKDDVLARTNEKNYTVENYEEFFKDIKYPTAYEMYKDTYKLAEQSLNPPGVEVHCLHGQGLSTPERMEFKKKRSFPDKPKLISGNGDGTVNHKSLVACSRWVGKQKEKVVHYSIPEMEHMKILSDKDIMEYIKYFVTTW